MKKPTIGNRTRAGYVVMVLRVPLQLPVALWIRYTERRELSPATQHMFKIFVEGSFGQANVHSMFCMLAMNTKANLQVQMPEKRPLL